MKTYTVHEPAEPASDPLKRADQLVFVKEGVAWLALFFPVIWLLVQRMWLVLVVFVLAAIAVAAAVLSVGASQQLAAWASLALGILLAVQANDLRRWKLDRMGYRMVAAVAGDSREDCERRFFADWTDQIELGDGYLPELEDVPGGWENDLDDEDLEGGEATSREGESGASGLSK